MPYSRLLQQLIAAACLASAVGQLTPNVIPYFRGDTPEDGTVYYSFPGKTFEFTIYVFDDDVNGTSNGEIKTANADFLVQRTGSGIQEGFNPYPSTNPQWSGAPAAVSMTQVGMWKNRTTISYSFTDNSVATFRLIPDPYREVCFTIRDNSIGTVTWNRRCFRIYVQVAPEFTQGCLFGVQPKTMPTLPSTLSIFVDNCPRLPMQTKNVIAVGQKFIGHFYFQDYNRDGSAACTNCDQVSITVLADPGLPNGASLRETVGGNADTQTPAEYTNLMAVRYRTPTAIPVYNHLFSRRLSFTPALEQSVTFHICMEATDIVISAEKQAAAGGLHSNVTRQCVELEVRLPETHMLENPAFAPHASLPLGTLESAPVVEAGVRCGMQFSVVLFEGKDFDASVVQREDRAGFEQDVYVPMMAEDPEHPLPAGAEVGAVERVAVCADRTKGCPESAQTFSVSHQLLSWTPARGMEGKQWTSCLLLRDQTLSLRAGFQRRCVTFRVTKCQLCTRHGDTLLSIAADYNTDWLQIWGANPNIGNPYDLSEIAEKLDNKLALGPLTELAEDEATMAVASRFRMTRKALLLINPELDSDADVLRAGTTLCVMPNICMQPSDVGTL